MDVFLTSQSTLPRPHLRSTRQNPAALLRGSLQPHGAGAAVPGRFDQRSVRQWRFGREGGGCAGPDSRVEHCGDCLGDDEFLGGDGDGDGDEVGIFAWLSVHGLCICFWLREEWGWERLEGHMGVVQYDYYNGKAHKAKGRGEHIYRLFLGTKVTCSNLRGCQFGYVVNIIK